MLFKSLSRAFVFVSLCVLVGSAVASKPAARLSRESLERRISEGAASGTKMLKQFDVRRAPRSHTRRQVSAAAADRQAEATTAANANTNTEVLRINVSNTAAAMAKETDTGPGLRRGIASTVLSSTSAQATKVVTNVINDSAKDAQRLNGVWNNAVDSTVKAGYQAFEEVKNISPV